MFASIKRRCQDLDKVVDELQWKQTFDHSDTMMLESNTAGDVSTVPAHSASVSSFLSAHQHKKAI